MSFEFPLRDLRVIDLADEKGELCGRLLADFGADVVRVEPPAGARSRGLPPFHDGQSLYFAYRNFNKRGAVLDLETSAGRERLHTLLAGADVMIESEAPGRLAAKNLDPAGLAERHPRLIVTSISDFGQTGPYRDWIGSDPVIEAVGGMITKAGLPTKPPLIPPCPIGYDVAGCVGALATLMAVWQRQRTGQGQHIDLAAMLALAQTTDWGFSNAGMMREKGLPYGDSRIGSGPVYTIYACKGGYVRLVVLSPRQWRAIWEWMGKPEAFADPYWEAFMARLQNADVLRELYTEHFASMTMDEVSAEAQRRGIVCTPVLRPEEVLANEHLRSRRSFVEVEIARGVVGPVAAGFHELDGERIGIRRRARSSASTPRRCWRRPHPGQPHRERPCRSARRPVGAAFRTPRARLRHRRRRGRGRAPARRVRRRRDQDRDAHLPGLHPRGDRRRDVALPSPRRAAASAASA
jgi:crotonobetainyl-CoA:carnitine CoA-transferase CaiB-like acyl-CoA transferase